MEQLVPRQGGVRLMARSITGGATVLDGVRPTETTICAVRIRVCAEGDGGGDPELIRLVHGGLPLDDVQRTLAEYGILEDTVLEVAPQTAKEGEERSAQAGALVLRAALAVEAASRMRAAVELHMGTERMMLCNADGTGKHERWVWLTVDEGPPPRVSVHWGKREDGADHFLWKRLSYAPPKQRTVTGVRAESLSFSELGYTIETEREGESVIFVADSAEQRGAWLAVLRLIAEADARLGESLPDAAVRSLAAEGCRSVADVGDMDRLAVDAETARTVACVDGRWSLSHSDIDILGEGGALAARVSDWGIGFDSAVCGEVLQADGEAYAEFTWVRGLYLRVGLARAGVDPSSLVRVALHQTADGWMYDCASGQHWHHNLNPPWASGRQQEIARGETVGLLLRQGTLAVYIQGRLVGVLCTGLTGPLVWATDLYYSSSGGDSVRIQRKPPPA